MYPYTCSTCIKLIIFPGLRAILMEKENLLAKTRQELEDLQESQVQQVPSLLKNFRFI